MEIAEIYKKFELLGDTGSVQQLERFGITQKNAFGVRMPELRKLAKDIGANHDLAKKLWKEQCHEAKILATLLADPKLLNEKLMEEWVKDFYSWDICDQSIMNLFKKSAIAYEKAMEWSKREPEFEKRAGFVLIACLALSDKKMEDSRFEIFFPVIIEGANDERNFVKKAVNWAIRQIGKRSMNLNRKAIALSKEVQQIDSKSAKWIAADAIRELTNEKTLKNIKR